MEAEQETGQNLEDVLNEGQTSPEQEEVSEEETTEESKAKAGEEEEPITFTPEQEAEIEKRFQSRRDKEFNPYREKRESDTALIRSLQSQVKELRSGSSVGKLSKAMDAVLAGDEEEGLETDKIEARRKGFEEIKTTIKDYKEKSAEVEETAQFIGDMTDKLPKNIVKEFGLDDPNPNVRAVNGVKFLDETVAVYKHNQDFLMAVEDFLPKGDELRKQIEEIVEGLSEFNDEKSKKLYLKDKMQGVKVTPRKKPQTPSDGAGGVSLPTLGAKTDTRELLERGFRKK